MLHREASVEIATQTQHSLNLRNRSSTQRWRQAPISQARWPSLSMPIPPPPERPFADPKQFRRFHLAQLRPLRTAQNIFETHPTYALVNACPIHPKPPSQEAQMTGHFTSYKTRPNHELATNVLIDLALGS